MKIRLAVRRFFCGARAAVGQAARDGLGDELLATSARRCLAIAAGRGPAELVPAIED